MKKLTGLLLLLLCFTINFTSCKDDYDDSDLRSQVDNINGEIDGIKAEIESLKTQITSVEDIVKALKENKVITNIEELSSGKGYKITFNDATSIEVLRGGNASSVSVQEVDGVYYWTIITNGKSEFIHDANGDNIAVSSSALTLNKDGYWTMNDKIIEDANGDLIRFSEGNGDSFFLDIIDGDSSVTFVLADNTKIVVDKKITTFIYFGDSASTQFYLLKKGSTTKLSFKFSADLSNIEVIGKPEGWRTNVHVPDKYVAVTPPANATFGISDIRLQGTDKNGMIFQTIAKVSIEGNGFSDDNGTYILNEGNMTTENGSLIYIDGAGTVMDNVYESINGSMLGNVTQDLFIANNKIYIISQNGKTNPLGTSFLNDGMLVVANSQTMKKEAAYSDELSILSWPTHISVLDDANIFLRDNKGVYVFNSTTRALNFVIGSAGAKKTRMAVADGKVFASIGTKLIVMEKDKMEVSATIDMVKTISGVIKADDGNIWVSTSGYPSTITKINSQTYEVIKSNSISEVNLSVGFMAATPAITAIGNILYSSSTGSKIYRHNFDTGETKLMVDVKTLVSNVNLIYNTAAVHPLTGKVYLNSIKGYGWDFVINNITVLKPSGDDLVLDTNYENYTRFPAGTYFPASFK